MRGIASGCAACKRQSPSALALHAFVDAAFRTVRRVIYYRGAYGKL